MNKCVGFVCFVIVFVISGFGCGRGVVSEYTPEERESINSAVRESRNSIDSLKLLLEHYKDQNNLIGKVLVNKELGRRYRESAMFNEAQLSHKAGLESATVLNDTLEIVQALNNIATNYRRMGILDEASTYHYKALTYSENYSDKDSYDAKKNHLVSLNGLGNIHLTLSNYDLAESVFRQALIGEKELNSDLGQAINYANIGSIFETREMADSAYYYYQLSMESNRAAKSDLGISLCYNHFGRLAEQRGAWEEALKEYRSAYDIMVNSSDKWHWLESCISLARVNISKGDIFSARNYLVSAEKTASEINSWEHLGEINRLQYLLSKENRDYLGALEYYVRSRSYSDSVRNEEYMNHMQNMRVNYEREKGLRELSLVQQNVEIEKRNKRTITVAAISILSLAAIALGFLLYALRMKSKTQQAMQKMEQARQTFFTNITHEFRTPMTVILGLTDQLKQKVIDEESQESLTTISRHGNSLLELVNQLLDVSRMRSAIGDPEWRNGDIVAYVGMVVENYRIYTRQQKIDLLFTSEEVAIAMDFVPPYLSKIMRNLLSNAIKFTPSGGHVYVTIAKRGQNTVITVADTGVGISAEDVPHIFESFYQGVNSKSNTGTGVGLSLVRQMAEAMGGTAEVKSAEGSGAVFTIVLPQKHGDTIFDRWLPSIEAEAPAPPKRVELPVGSVAESESPMLLIVEDNIDVADYIGSLLKDRYRLIFAGNGSEGLEKAEEYMPDLIVTDLMMPEMDGYEMCRRVRQSEILSHIPIIIVTARSEDSDRIQGLEIGADAYLLKPFNAEELNVRISKLLEQRRLLREKYSRALREGTENSIDILPGDRDFVTRLTDLVFSKIDDNGLTSEGLADKMCMSQSQLNRKLKSITGYNTSSYILQIRMEKAQRLLASTELPIGEVAVKCGFEDQSHFTRAFKQMFGITPSQYRKHPKN